MTFWVIAYALNLSAIAGSRLGQVWLALVNAASRWSWIGEKGCLLTGL